MAIDIPPALPPVLVDMDAMLGLYRKSSSPFVSGRAGSHRIEVIGFPYFSPKQIEELMGASANASDFIRALNRAYHRNGNLLVQLLYRQHEDTVYVYVVQCAVDSLEGPDSIVDHFDSLNGEKDLSASEFERHRALADIKAQRQGVDYAYSYRLSEDFSSVAITIAGQPATRPDNDEVYLEAGNQGNRYIGQYLATAGLTHSFTSGGEIEIDYAAVIPDQGTGDSEASYDRLALAANYPSVFGFNSFSLSYQQYEREDRYSDIVSVPAPLLAPACQAFCLAPLSTTEEREQLLQVNGQTTNAVAGAEQLLAAGIGYRLSLQEQLQWVDDEISAREQGVLLDESYGVLGVGSKLMHGVRRSGHTLETELALQLKGGLGDNDGTFATDSDPEAVSIGKRSARFIIVQPSLRSGFEMLGAFKFDVHALAQYSSGVQLPQMQQFVLGGISLISAYLPGILVGDSGAYVGATLSATGLGGEFVRLIPAIFVEHGRSRFENASGSDAEIRSISDAGLRFTLEIGKNFSLEMVTATPIDSQNLPQQTLDEMGVDFFGRFRITL